MDPFLNHLALSTSTPDEFLHRFREGHSPSFKKVYECHYKLIYIFVDNLLKKSTESGVDANDIVSETFIKLWHHRRKIDKIENIKAFLFVTARNACRDHFRRLCRLRACHEEIKSTSASTEAELNAAIEAHVLFDYLAQGIETLPTGCKTVFNLIYNGNLTTDQVAEKLSISPRTVLNQKNKAIHILRKWILSQNNFALLALFESFIHRKP
jgi:RNA polymerase sigma-70 factor (ECF subfamily)